MVRFEGFGLNWKTALLVALVIWLAISGLLVKPVLVQDGDQASAVTAPCVAYSDGWHYKWVQIEDSGVGWSIYVKARLAYNNCDVKVVSGTQSCWTGLLVGIGFDQWNCSNYRLYTETAYSEQVVVRGAWAVHPFFNGFPITSNNHYLCGKWNRQGGKIAEYEGPYVADNCGF